MRPRYTPFVIILDPEEEGGQEGSQMSLVVVVRVIGRVVLENIRNLRWGREKLAEEIDTLEREVSENEFDEKMKL